MMNRQNNLVRPSAAVSSSQAVNSNQAINSRKAVKPNKVNKLVLTALFSVVLVACGGGSSDKESSESSTLPVPATTSSNDSSNEQTDTQAANDAADKTAELVSTPEFDFAGSFALDVTIAAAPAGNKQYYVNICSDFEQVEAKQGAPASWQVNYESCLLRTFITGQAQAFALSLSESQNALIAQVWPMESGAMPIDLFWQKQSEDSEWLITF